MARPQPAPSRSLRSSLLTTLAAVLLAGAMAAQDPDPPISRPGGPPPGSPPRLPEGMTEDQMWPVPTAEDWRKPVQITFQRSWEDAVAVSRETGKAILICINMDGEIASEHYAGIRYRSPETAALYEPYVCVIASVYRHTPRDYDENGNRILCPRFGSVTCGEHIEIEPFLYERYMDGRRISPRHIMVELDGRETYDIFFAWDTDSVFTTIRDGIANREAPPPVVRGDRPLVERVASRDIEDRKAVEAAYREGDAELRQRLLEAAAEHPDAVPTDLLRLAVLGFDPELAKLAREALLDIDSPNAVDVIAEALRVPLETAEREQLVAALERLGGSSDRARTLAVVHRGLTTESNAVDVGGWSSAMQGGGTYAPPPGWSSLESRVESRAEVVAAKPDDAAARLQLAEASLRLAVDPETTQALGVDRRTASDYAKLMFEDARRQAEEAAELGATGWRVDAVLALTAYYLGDEEEAHARAIAAMEDMPPDPQEWQAVATLALFAQARQRAIWRALRAKTDWPGEWMTDVNAAYSVLARHPLGTDQHAVTHYDFLNSLGAKRRAGTVLEEGLERFPNSWLLHDRLRERILAEKGVKGLEPTYAAMLDSEGASKYLPWFAGYASIVAAEFHRRDGDLSDAIAAYDRALALYDRAIEADPETRATSDHYAALALAGKARIAIEQRDLPRAVEDLVAAFARRPEATASLDGLNISPAETSRLLRSRLADAGLDDLVAKLDAALAELDPVLLEPPAFERTPDPRGRRGPGGRGRRGR